MMNKAQKKLIEAQVIEEMYTLTLERANLSNLCAEDYKKELQELLEEGEKGRQIENKKTHIENYETKTEAYNKLAEQLFKLM